MWRRERGIKSGGGGADSETALVIGLGAVESASVGANVVMSRAFARYVLGKPASARARRRGAVASHNREPLRAGICAGDKAGLVLGWRWRGAVGTCVGVRRPVGVCVVGHGDWGTSEIDGSAIPGAVGVLGRPGHALVAEEPAASLR